MLAHLVKRFLQPLLSTGSAKPNLTTHLRIEALESRSLMDANAFVRGLYANILERAPSDAEVNGWISQIQAGESHCKPSVPQRLSAARSIWRLVVSSDYTNLLGRSADQQGVNYWAQQMANGMSQDQVEASIASSGEFLQKHGSTNTDFIQGLYETVLHRMADSAEPAYWNQQLDFRTDGQTTHLDVSDRIPGAKRGPSAERGYHLFPTP